MRVWADIDKMKLLIDEEEKEKSSDRSTTRDGHQHFSKWVGSSRLRLGLGRSARLLFGSIKWFLVRLSDCKEFESEIKLPSSLSFLCLEISRNENWKV